MNRTACAQRTVGARIPSRQWGKAAAGPAGQPYHPRPVRKPLVGTSRRLVRNQCSKSRTVSRQAAGCALGLVFLAVFLPPAVHAGKASGTVQSTRLYTKPDPQARGGLTANISLPRERVLDVFAMLATDPVKLYKGQVTDDGNGFRFKGLPVGKYDLVVLYEDRFYEGLGLTRVTDSLTASDRDSIEQALRRSVPFFDTKAVHRAAGTTGRAGHARVMLQELRTRKIVDQNGTVLAGFQIRSLKLAWLEDVGKTGWHLVGTREIVRTEVAPGDRQGVLGHTYNPRLGGIRVIDTVKDLGTLNLDQKGVP